MDNRQVPPTEQAFLFGTWNHPTGAPFVDPSDNFNMQTNMQYDQSGSANDYGKSYASHNLLIFVSVGGCTSTGACEKDDLMLMSCCP